MSHASVVFDRVWKKFQRGERHSSLRDLVPSVVKRMVGPRKVVEDLGEQEFWALKDVGFEVGPGEALGIIGPNGAGKSTTLKLLTKILKPTKGMCKVEGRVGALIEIAAGFHPDLTGRENVYLQGAIMGMKRREIAKKMDVIIDFAGTQAFADTPLKRYSSGMNARLGFSIAAHLDPDVLLIDEVLAVGDLAFQEKCYQRMQEFKRNGAAIVFVSHNLPAVGALCDRVAVVYGGKLVDVAAPSQAFATYASLGSSREADVAEEHRVELLDMNGKPTTSISAGDPLRVRAVMKSPQTKTAVAFQLLVRRIETGELAFLTTSASMGEAPVALPEGSSVDVEWDVRANLARGHYVFEVAIYELARRNQIMTATSAPLAIQERQSELGMTYFDVTCSSTIIADGEVVDRREEVAEVSAASGGRRK